MFIPVRCKPGPNVVHEVDVPIDRQLWNGAAQEVGYDDVGLDCRPERQVAPSASASEDDNDDPDDDAAGREPGPAPFLSRSIP